MIVRLLVDSRRGPGQTDIGGLCFAFRRLGEVAYVLDLSLGPKFLHLALGYVALLLIYEVLLNQGRGPVECHGLLTVVDQHEHVREVLVGEGNRIAFGHLRDSRQRLDRECLGRSRTVGFTVADVRAIEDLGDVGGTLRGVQLIAHLVAELATLEQELSERVYATALEEIRILGIERLDLVLSRRRCCRLPVDIRLREDLPPGRLQCLEDRRVAIEFRFLRLLDQERRGREVICTANYKAVSDVLEYVREECCAGLEANQSSSDEAA